MNNNSKVLKQLNTMILITIIIQVFILIQNAIVAYYFGVGQELDAFNLANRISTFTYSFIGAGVSTVIIPYLRDKVYTRGVNIFITIIYSIGLILLILMIIYRQEIILLTGGSNNHYFIELASNILIFTAIAGFLNSLIQLIKGILEFNDKFTIQKIIVLASNIILVTLLLFGNSNIYYYALVVLLAAVINLTLHLIFSKKVNFNYRMDYNLKNPDFKEMLILFFPTMLSTGVFQIAVLIDTLIAARLPIGSISILSYANAVIGMINLLLLSNITSFVYPKLIKKNCEVEKQKSLIQYIILVNTLMFFIFVLFFSVGREGISILFERGNFTSDDTSMIYIVALILALSLPTNAIRELLYRYFYMHKNTFTPFLNSIMISAINIVLSIILAKYFGLYGVVLGTILASYFSLFFISIRFKQKFIIYFDKKMLILECGKIFLISFLTLLASITFKQYIDFENTIIRLVVYGLFTSVLFIVLLKILRSKVLKLKL